MSEWSEVASVRTQKIPVPSNFRVYSEGWYAIKASWDCVPCESGEEMNYILMMKGASDREFTEIYRGGKTKIKKSNLKQDTEYSFRIRSVYKDKMSEWSEVATTKTQKISAPSDLTATSATSDSINLSWKGAEGASYRIESDGKVLNDEIESNTFAQKGLFPDTEYTFRIRTVKGNEESEWSDSLKVRNGKAPDFSECIWKDCPDDVDEKREYSVDDENPTIATKKEGKDWCTIIGNTLLPLQKVSSWSIKILDSKRNDGDGIYIGVAPSDIDQNGWHNYEECGWYFACYSSTLCSGPPHNHRGKKYGPRKENGECVHTGDSVGVVMDTAKGELSFVLNGMDLGVSYKGIPLDKPLVPCVLLKYKGDSVEIKSARMKRNAVDSSISVPSNIITKNTTWDSITLTWDSVEGASSYQIEVNGSKFWEAPTTSTFTKRGLLPETEHTFRVRAVKGNSRSGWSDAVKGRTQKTSDFSECVWKECPDYVEWSRKYSVDEENPRIS